MNSPAAMSAVNQASPLYDAAYGQQGTLPASAVSWAAIVAGAIAAAALSIILLILGTGLGLSAVSPWAPSGISASALGVSAIVWITFTQVLASSMGGYLAGRLRSRWVAVHTDEVYFRDTAHGFLAWAVATLVTAGVLASATGAVVGSGVQAGASVAHSAATGAAGAAGIAGGSSMSGISGMSGSGADKSDASGNDISGYFVDALFRKDLPFSSASTAAPVANQLLGASPSAATGESAPGPAMGAAGPAPAVEVSRIFATSIRSGSLMPADVRYVGQLVAQRTGLAQSEAEKRVTDSFARLQTKLKEFDTAARDTADKARKASAYAALWIFISLLAGAFTASLAATFGGRQRDVQMPALSRPLNV